MESVVKANVPDAEQSLVHAGSCKLPAFLMADDAVEALEVRRLHTMLYTIVLYKSSYVRK
eukprot:2490409-Pyramimonas_sp.AAC.1